MFDGPPSCAATTFTSGRGPRSGSRSGLAGTLAPTDMIRPGTHHLVPRALTLTLGAALAGSLLAAPAASADEYTASSGQVAATLSFEPGGDYEYYDLWLTVTRAGAPAYDEP